MNLTEIKKQLKTKPNRQNLLIGASIRVSFILFAWLLLAMPRDPSWAISSSIYTHIVFFIVLLFSLGALAAYFFGRFEFIFSYFSPIVLDMLGITVLVAFTGGLYSPFIFLYPIELLGIFFLDNFWKGILISILGASFYSVMIVVTIIMRMEFQPVFSPDIPLSDNSVLFMCSIALGIVFVLYTIVQAAFLRKRADVLQRRVDQFQRVLNKSSVELMSSFHDLESVADRLKEQEIQSDSANAQLMMADRYATLGWLSASIIHEFNNPLTSIITEIETMMLKKGADISPTTRQACKRALDNTGRIQTLVSNLTQTIRPQGQNFFTIVDINRLIMHIVDLMKTEALKKATEITTSLSGERPNIFAVDGQIEQMFINIISNSLQAIENIKGQIIIKTVVEDNDLVCTIQDNGKGIDEKDLPYIFEPFFSSFSEQAGTGLGLLMVKEILENHRGRISVHSRPTEGTIVTIHLPMKPPEN